MNQFDYKYSRYIDTSRETGWATVEEMQKTTVHLDLSKTKYKTCGLPIMSDGKNAYVHSDDGHALIYGSTGSKKTRCLILPMINMILRAEESFVCTDPKGELYARTASAAQKQGYNIIVLDYRNFQCGDGWNPFSMIYDLYHTGDRDKSIDMMNDFISSISASQRKASNVDPFWQQKASALALASMMFLIESATKETANISSFLSLCFEENYEKLDELSKRMEKSSLAGMAYRSVFTASDRTRQSIAASLSAMIDQYANNEALQRQMSETTFSMERIGREKTAVYLMLADEKDTYHFMASTFLKQLYESLISVAQGCENNALPKRVNFIMEEFANLPRIDNFENAISAARSRNIRYYLVVQSLHQLYSKYGNTAGEVIRSNCADWVYLNSREMSLLTELSDLCGQKIGRNGFEPLVTPSQLQRLEKGQDSIQALIMAGRNKPFLTNLADIDQYTCFHTKEIAELPPRKFGNIKHLMDLEQIYSEVCMGLRICPFGTHAAPEIIVWSPEHEEYNGKPNNATERMIQMISSIAEFLQNVNSEKLAAAVEDDSLPQGEFEEIRLCEYLEIKLANLLQQMNDVLEKLGFANNDDIHIFDEEDDDEDISQIQKHLEELFGELFPIDNSDEEE